MSRRSRLRVAAAVALLAVLEGSDAARPRAAVCQCSYPPPPSGSDSRAMAAYFNGPYRNWCVSCCGGTYSAGSCQPGPNSKCGAAGVAGGAGLPAGLAEANMVVRILQGLSALFSDDSREAEERARRQREIEAQYRARLRRELAAAYERMKDRAAAPLGMKGEERQLDLKPIDMATARTPLDGAWAQLYCSSWLSAMGAEAAARGDPEEARYLQNQAALAMTGSPMQVACPPPPPLPQAQGTRAPPARVSMLRQLAESTDEQLLLLRDIADRIQRAAERRDDAVRRAAESRQTVERLRQQGEDTLLLEAQRALERARADSAEAQGALEAAVAERERAREVIGRNASCVQRAQSNAQLTSCTP